MPSGLKPILWIHGLPVPPDHPALVRFPEAPAVFVFDEKLLLSQGVALVEIGGLHQALLDLPVTLREGEAVAEIRAFADLHQANQVITTDSPYSCVQRVIRELKDGLMLRVLR